MHELKLKHTKESANAHTSIDNAREIGPVLAARRSISSGVEREKTHLPTAKNRGSQLQTSDGESKKSVKSFDLSQNQMTTEKNAPSGPSNRAMTSSRITTTTFRPLPRKSKEGISTIPRLSESSNPGPWLQSRIDSICRRCCDGFC